MAYSFEEEHDDDGAPHEGEEVDVPGEDPLEFSTRVDHRLGDLEGGHEQGVVGEENILYLDIAGADIGVDETDCVIEGVEEEAGYIKERIVNGEAGGAK